MPQFINLGFFNGNFRSQFCVKEDRPAKRDAMNRYNLFHKIHKGLRALLYDTSMLLQRTDFTLAEEAEEAICRVQFAVSLFDQFQQSEDNFVLPVMMDYEPGLADSFEHDHEESYEMGKKLQRLAGDFQAATLPFEKIAISGTLLALFEEFTLFSILHMTREEQIVNKVLWRYYTDAELQKISWKIINAAESPFIMPYNKWMFRGLNNNEIIRWLKEVKETAREREFESLLKTAEAELHPQRWSLLQDVLLTGRLLAN